VKLAVSQRLIPAGRTIWIADAHRDGKRFVVRADELLTVFMELKSEQPGVEPLLSVLD
jgi:hypothetical protein